MWYTSEGIDRTRFTPLQESSYSEEPARDREKEAAAWFRGGFRANFSSRRDFSSGLSVSFSVAPDAPSWSLTFTSCSSSLCASASQSSSSSLCASVRSPSAFSFSSSALARAADSS